MDNHYHFIIQNSSGKMGEFFRRLNGEFANFYRKKNGVSLEGIRSNDQYFEPIGKIYYEFKRKYGVNPDNIKTNTFEGKRLRGKLLINLKDRGGLTYREIKEFGLFSDVKFNSLGKMYSDAVKKENKK